MAITLSRIMKKAASSAIPLANTTHHRNYFFSNPSKTRGTTVRSLSTSIGTNLSSQVSRAAMLEISNPDESLLSILDSVIVRPEEKLLEEAPSGFPFKTEHIVETSGCEYITLTREYQDEKIEVKVCSPDTIFNDYVAFGVSVSKTNGKTLKLNVQIDEGVFKVGNFSVRKTNAFESFDDIIGDKGPTDLSNLDENLQKAILAYLKLRGIEPSLGKFLHEYDAMVRKDHERHTRSSWLKTVKDFIAN